MSRSPMTANVNIHHREYVVAVVDLAKALTLDFSTVLKKAKWLKDHKEHCVSVKNNKVVGVAGEYLTDKKARELCRSKRKFDLEEGFRLYRLQYIPPKYHEKTDDLESLKKKYV